jgi:hypothetical protein
LHDHSPNNPDTTNNPAPLTATVQSETTTDPMPNANANAPTANAPNNNAQNNPSKILYSMINPRSIGKTDKNGLVRLNENFPIHIVCVNA